MKKAALFLLLFGVVIGFGRAQTLTKGQVLSVKAAEPAVTERGSLTGSGITSRNPGDLIVEYDMETLTGDVRLLGIEFHGSHWYMTGARDYAGCYFYQVDYAATSVIHAVSTGHSGWGWRDLAWDGTYLYASDSFDLEQIDPATGVATGVVIPGPISPCRAVAYDSATDTFWTAGYNSNLYQFDRTGFVHQSIVNPGLSICGAAMDETNNILWWWSQDGTGTLASAMDPATGTLTGDTWDGGAGTWPGDAAGACIFDDVTHGLVFGGMHQTTPGNVCVYSLKPDPMPQFDVTVNGGDAGVVVYAGSNARIDCDLEARQGVGVNVDIWLALNTPFGFFTYDGAGPVSGWNSGLGNVFYTGPMADMSGTVLDRALPLGSYKIHFGADTLADGNLSLGKIIGSDNVDFEVKAFSGFLEDFDDGVADGFVPTGAGAAGWLVANGTYQCDNSLVYLFDYLPSYYMTTAYADFNCEVDCTEEDGYQAYFYGMVLRGDGVTAKGDNYVCYFTNDGSLGFDVYAGGVATSLSWTTPASFLPGYMNWNMLKVEAQGSNFEIYVNGVLEASVSDTTHSTGYFGLFGEGSGSGTNHYHFDNLRVW